MTRLLSALVALSLWLGAALISVGVVAPGAFAVLPTRALAGDVVGRVLPWLFATAILVHAGVPLFVPLLRRNGAAVVASIVAALSAAVAIWVVNPRIAALRAAAVVPIDQLAPIDPRRAMFGALHGVSVGLLGLAMIGNALLIVVVVRAVRQTAAHAPSDA